MRRNALRLLRPTEPAFEPRAAQCPSVIAPYGAWEHLICDDADFQAHMDYVHLNPLKHGLVTRVSDWPYSTFHRLVERGMYPADWAGSVEPNALAYDD